MHRLLRFSLLALVTLTAASANADTTAVSSLVTPSPDGTNVSKTHWLADKFTTGSDVRFLDVSSITIDFADSSGTGGYFVNIYTDVAGTQPGTLLAALSGSTDPHDGDLYVYTPITTLTLDASTTYWLVEGSTTSTNVYQPTYTTSPSSFTGHGWTITGTYIFSTDSGGSWTGGGSDGPTQYRIGVDFVPEPSTYAAIAGILSIGAILVRRRRPKTV